MKQKKVNKLTPPFNPTPCVIIAIKGSMITAKSSKDESKVITRNVSFFKRIKSRTKSYTQSYDELSEDDDIVGPPHLHDESDSSNDTNGIPLTNDEDEVTDNYEIEHDLPRRNPPRMRK